MTDQVRTDAQEPIAGLAAEASRLLETLCGAQHSPAADCAWCPLCRLAASVRADQPELAAKLVAAGAAFVEAIRELFATMPQPAAPPPTARVQRIDLDGGD